MDTKTLIGILLLVLVAGYIFTTEEGKEYLESAKSLLKTIKPETFEQKGKREVGIRLKSFEKGMKVEFKDSLISVFGRVLNFDLKTIKIKKEEALLKLRLKDGFLQLGNSSLKIFGKADWLEISEVEFSPSEPIKINLEIVPVFLNATKVYSSSLKLGKSFGNISSERVFIKLFGEKLEVLGFEGDLLFSKETTSLKGKISKLLINDERAFV